MTTVSYYIANTNPGTVYAAGELYPIEQEWEPGRRFGFPLQPDHSVRQQTRKLVTQSPCSYQLEQGMEHKDCVAIPPYSENGHSLYLSTSTSVSISILTYFFMDVYIYLFT
jgi:hypothetical protein